MVVVMFDGLLVNDCEIGQNETGRKKTVPFFLSFISGSRRSSKQSITSYIHTVLNGNFTLYIDQQVSK